MTENNNKKKSRRGNNTRRGNGGKSNNSSSGNKKKSNERTVKFAPYSNNTKGSYATFDTVKEAVVTKVSESVSNYAADIIKALETDTEVNFEDPEIKPKRATPDKDKAAKMTDEEKAEFKAEADQIYGFELKAWINRKEAYVNNKHKAYDIGYRTVLDDTGRI